MTARIAQRDNVTVKTIFGHRTGRVDFIYADGSFCLEGTPGFTHRPESIVFVTKKVPV